MYQNYFVITVISYLDRIAHNALKMKSTAVKNYHRFLNLTFDIIDQNSTILWLPAVMSANPFPLEKKIFVENVFNKK